MDARYWGRDHKETGAWVLGDRQNRGVYRLDGGPLTTNPPPHLSYTWNSLAYLQPLKDAAGFPEVLHAQSEEGVCRYVLIELLGCSSHSWA